MAFIIPFSVELRDVIPKVDFGFSLPSELMLAGISIVFLFRILLENSYPLVITKHKISLVILFYLFWIFVTSIVSTIPMVSFKFFIAKLWFVIPVYFLFAQYLKKDIRSGITFFLCYAVGLAIVASIVTTWHIQVAGIKNVAYRVTAPFYNDHTAYGAVLAFFISILSVIPFIKSIPRWQRGLSLALLFPMVIGLYLSFSRAAWLSLLFSFGLCFILLLGIRIRRIFFVGTAVIVLLFSFQNEIMNRLSKNTQDSSAGNFAEHIQSITNITSDASNVERLNRWSAAIKMFKEKPVFGWGPGTYQFNYAPYQNPAYRTRITTNAGTGGNAHSEYLGPLSESGLIGLISVLALIFTVLGAGIDVYRRAQDQCLRLLALMCVLALTTYFCHGILNNFLDTEKLAVPVFGAMAVIAVCNIKLMDNG
ncbi:MAG: O-antigen ligase family protein [Bacteroidales bacterium]|nr:O-antigen ligase family protein [Bacteroidales bacterium]